MNQPQPRLVVPQFRWSDVDLPRWQWGLVLSRQFMEDVAQGERLPDGYGIAYIDYNRDVAVCMVMPLNVLVGAIRTAWRWLRFPPWMRGVYKDRADARAVQAELYAVKQYDAGKRDGFAEGLDVGYVRGWNEHNNTMNRVIDKFAGPA